MGCSAAQIDVREPCERARRRVCVGSTIKVVKKWQISETRLRQV
jgi:hypothetical protein